MKIIYGRPVCPACLRLKAELAKNNVPFAYVTVYDAGTEPRPPGECITRADFNTLYPDIRTFPLVIDQLDKEQP